MSPAPIRNFCIIAHIDHGKSTLADRFLEHTHAVSGREMHSQFLDQMDLEQERGITIKLQPVRMSYPFEGTEYMLNLIDTPGHVDFSYEVSRSLAACEGAILVVDASQGIQAQTIAHVYQATLQGLEIIPVLNKIDLPNARPDEVNREIETSFGFPADSILEASAKEGIGIDQILDAVVRRIPAPTGDADKPLQALIFDSIFDSYQGIVTYIRVMQGTIEAGDGYQFAATNAPFTTDEVGIFTPSRKPTDQLKAGEIGYVLTGLKDISQARVGDTIVRREDFSAGKVQALPGYKKVQPLVYAGLYCVDSDRYSELKKGLEKLQLNDSSLTYESRQSTALGFGFFCGFLGLLHLEIVTERLKREFDLDVIITSPTVPVHVTLANGNTIEIHSADEFPAPDDFTHVEELWSHVEIVAPATYIGPLMELCQQKRGVHKNTRYLNVDTALLEYDMPLINVISHFYDQLKSKSQGYASLHYELRDFRSSDLVKLDVHVNDEIVSPFSTIIHRDDAERIGRRLIKQLKELIPKHQFSIPIQASINGKIIARETISAYRKDVTAKLYGGDVSRKTKLLRKQKAGKKKMKAFGRVDIPHQAFLDVLKK
jgi:GTP-binding protein LepA